MLRPRVIPCLLVHNGGLVKTVNFQDSKYVGDPINAVKIFNEKEVDELIVLDIDATREKRDPDYKMIEDIARECRMPLCYGGGIRSVDQAKRILGLGVEKVALSTRAIESPETLTEIANQLGVQSVVVVLDVKKKRFGARYDVWLDNGSRSTKESVESMVKNMQEAGAGEIVINSIDKDGCMNGYDTDLVELIESEVSVPLTILGGAGSTEDIKKLIERFGIIGAAAGSLFVFKGVYRAVLINYPDKAMKNSLVGFT